MKSKQSITCRSIAAHRANYILVKFMYIYLALTFRKLKFSFKYLYSYCSLFVVLCNSLAMLDEADDCNVANECDNGE